MGRIEAAHGGTLFLDEIGEMPLALQAKMLRFLESGELQRVGENEMLRVDVRIVSATHQHLRQRASEKSFRLDLYHRLAVFPVSIPALRDRIEDVLPLAEHLLGKMGVEMPVKRLSPSAARKLMEHDWPGNVRCLSHVLERATICETARRSLRAIFSSNQSPVKSALIVCCLRCARRRWISRLLVHLSCFNDR